MNKKIEIDFPDNIIDDLRLDYESVIDNFEDKLYVVLGKALMPREQRCIILRYIEQKKLEEVAKEIGVTRERVRQIIAKALRRISRYEYYFTYGYFKQNELIEEERKKYIEANKDRWDEESAFVLLQEKGRIPTPQNKEVNYSAPISYCTEIEQLDLTCRTYNCLKRANLNTIGDVVEYTYEDVLRIRNLGRKSVKELIQKLAEYGFKLKEEVEEDEN